MISRIEAWISLAGDRVLAGEMVCEIESDGRGRGAFRYASLERLGQSWGVSGAVQIVDQVFSAVADWRQEFKACGVALRDIERFSEIDDYLKR